MFRTLFIQRTITWQIISTLTTEQYSLFPNIILYFVIANIIYGVGVQATFIYILLKLFNKCVVIRMNRHKSV